MDTDDIFDLLTERVGGLAKESTGRDVILGTEGVWNKPSGEFILVDLQAAEPVFWGNNEGINEEGNYAKTQNFVVTYLLTSFRGKTSSSLSKVVQALNLPHLYYKFFPTDSPFAYSSCSSVSRTRVPLEEQTFENQSSVILNFNVCFIESDLSFETLQDINLDLVVKNSPDDEGITISSNIVTPDIAKVMELYDLVNDDLPEYGKSTWINPHK